MGCSAMNSTSSKLKDIPVCQALAGFFRPTAWERAVTEGPREPAYSKPQSYFRSGLPDGRLRDGPADVLKRSPPDFVPVRLEKSGPVASREYFRRQRRAAIRQRSR